MMVKGIRFTHLAQSTAAATATTAGWLGSWLASDVVCAPAVITVMVLNQSSCASYAHTIM